MIWEVELHRVLIHDHTRFELDASFASDASRLVLHGPSGAGVMSEWASGPGSRPNRRLEAEQLS